MIHLYIHFVKNHTLVDCPEVPEAGSRSLGDKMQGEDRPRGVIS